MAFGFRVWGLRKYTIATRARQTRTLGYDLIGFTTVGFRVLGFGAFGLWALRLSALAAEELCDFCFGESRLTGRFMGSYKSGFIRPVMWVITVAIPHITLLLTYHEPPPRASSSPSRVYAASGEFGFVWAFILTIIHCDAEHKLPKNLNRTGLSEKPKNCNFQARVSGGITEP